jgi:HD-like signal output (HDOD) protein
MNRILYVAADLTRGSDLRAHWMSRSTTWEWIEAQSGTQAMEIFGEKQVDVIVADSQIEDIDSGLLLVWVYENSPKTLRVILADPNEREQVERATLTPHYCLTKPVSAQEVENTVRQALALDAALPNDKLARLASRIRTFPSLPSLYFQIMKELESADFSAEQVAEIIAKDMAMSTRLLQVLNSGFYGSSRQITDVVEAVNMLGQKALESLIISIHLFATGDKIKPLYFSISRVWKHSTAVAHAARCIALLETHDAKLADQAYAAGLLHDVGQLVLANNFDSEYNKVQLLAKNSGRPLWLIETESFGVSHAEVGAFLLGRWGMPVELLEATAHHHRPSRSTSKEFNLLTALHVANELEQELHPAPEGFKPGGLDLDYLGSLGLTSRVEAWKEALIHRAS